MKKLIVPVLVTALLSVSAISFADIALKTDQDKISYAMGAVTGKALKDSRIDVNTDAFAAGLADVQTGKLQMSDDQIKQTLAAFQAQQKARAESELKTVADTNLRRGKDFLANNATKPDIKTIAVVLPDKAESSVLQYRVINPGNMTQPPPTLADEVTVEYTGSKLDGKIFDSTSRAGEGQVPVTFPVNGVILGWQKALTRMHPGATWEVFIPSELAYGTSGAGPSIGPNEVLIFKIHLISVARKTGNA